MAPAEVSARAEQRRSIEPRFLTHRVFSMGCLLSEGRTSVAPPESLVVPDVLESEASLSTRTCVRRISG